MRIEPRTGHQQSGVLTAELRRTPTLRYAIPHAELRRTPLLSLWRSMHGFSTFFCRSTHTQIPTALRLKEWRYFTFSLGILYIGVEFSRSEKEPGSRDFRESGTFLDFKYFASMSSEAACKVSQPFLSSYSHIESSHQMAGKSGDTFQDIKSTTVGSGILQIWKRARILSLKNLVLYIHLRNSTYTRCVHKQTANCEYLSWYLFLSNDLKTKINCKTKIFNIIFYQLPSQT